MRSLKNIQDIVDWGLCIGCGSCYYECTKGAVSLKNFESIGIRPVFKKEICDNCTDCLESCPGYYIDARPGIAKDDSSGLNEELLIGPTLEVWEGYACNEKIRYNASSGGAVTALALYCLEKENMELVLHTGMDKEKPWLNKTVQSRNINDLLSHAGSRYQTSSPCESLRVIEECKKPAVFIGRPCDVAALSKLRKKHPQLDAKLGLVLTFFCAGTPSTKGTLDLIKKLDVDLGEVNELRYRGKGWPGGFSLVCKNEGNNKFIPYLESWAFLNKYRTFRCQICPDGLGELADISCGDAWHKYSPGNNNNGLSLVLARSQHGKEIISKALAAGYLDLIKSTPSDVIKAQELIKRRRLVFGRQLAMRLLLIPTTKYRDFQLFKIWRKNGFETKIRSILGTVRRLLVRGLWHRNPLAK